jgi:transcriptional regulator with XRE-family HTH domain
VTKLGKRTTIDNFILREKREEAGLRQEDLADLSGVDRGLISKLETGARGNINLHTAVAIARALGTTVDSLLHKPAPVGDKKCKLVEDIQAQVADMSPDQLDRVIDYIRYQRRTTDR